MKKNLFRIAAMLMAGSLLFLSCNKDDQPGDTPGGNDKPGGKEQPGGKDQPGGDTGSTILLDGAFDDWDALTEEVAKTNNHVDVAKGKAGETIQLFKIAADADNIYFYIEFLADHLPQNDACGSWGSSYSENTLDVELGPDDEAFREVMHLFIDPDGNGSTGFLPFAGDDGETPAIPALGCEMCAQFFMCFKPSTGTINVAFEQTLIGPTKTGKVGDNDQVDGDYTGNYNYNGTICQSWPDSGDEAAFPLWGWQNPDDSGTGDNDCPRPENWKSSKIQGNIVKVEFSVPLDDIVNLKSDDDDFACGIIIDWSDEYYQAIGPLNIEYVK